ncbi:hypothetical protein, partial [Vibrio cholerae]|uniref:hypothetical protein n=1 Tax=Vibrio cholerae TaxID=666 RepID=UPI001FEDE195
LRNEYAHKIHIDTFPEQIYHIESSLSLNQRKQLQELEVELNEIDCLRYAIISIIFIIEKC